MFAYEMHQDHSADLRRQADEWRRAQEAKAAGGTERRAARAARRTQGRAAGTARGSEGADGAASPGSVYDRRRAVTGRLHQAFHPHHTA
jgi:hypothetical protein